MESLRNFRLGVTEAEIPSIAKHSLVNCHVRGVDSIMFDDTPGKRIRVFVAGENHELCTNEPPFLFAMSAAIHPHHCNVTLDPHSGPIYNVIAYPSEGRAERVVKFLEFKFQSAINNAQGSFVLTGQWKTLGAQSKLMTEPVHMKANVLHTMWSPKGAKSAWFVYEHEEDTNYSNVAYSNWNLEKFSFQDFYKPMSEDYLRKLLNELKIPVLP
jgi:hypothetical protein